MWIVRVSALMLSCGVLFAQQGRIAITGDTARGQALVEGKGNCLTCHRIKDTGSRFGPDLSQIGGRTPEQLMTSLIDPDAEILPANRTYRVVLKDGTTVDGRLLNQDSFTVQIIDTKENLRGFTKSDLKSYAILDKSPMPSYIRTLERSGISGCALIPDELKAASQRGSRRTRRSGWRWNAARWSTSGCGSAGGGPRPAALTHGLYRAIRLKVFLIRRDPVRGQIVLRRC
jgi:putative heme-binding domain-containing protein